MLRKFLLGGVASSFVVLAAGSANAVIFYGDEMDRAREMTTNGSGFDGYLAREYRDFFLFEADQRRRWRRRLVRTCSPRIPPSGISTRRICPP